MAIATIPATLVRRLVVATCVFAFSLGGAIFLAPVANATPQQCVAIAVAAAPNADRGRIIEGCHSPNIRTCYTSLVVAGVEADDAYDACEAAQARTSSGREAMDTGYRVVATR
ncbi:hypothetical protein ABH926_007197 [Catenulispora sp. GP43]|uniref:hypothetical protein n=1 Tax=Catenulispora sp. GP43 TaxID=3156263 RepID=UPI00351139F2